MTAGGPPSTTRCPTDASCLQLQRLAAAQESLLQQLQAQAASRQEAHRQVEARAAEAQEAVAALAEELQAVQDQTAAQRAERGKLCASLEQAQQQAEARGAALGQVWEQLITAPADAQLAATRAAAPAGRGQQAARRWGWDPLARGAGGRGRSARQSSALRRPRVSGDQAAAAQLAEDDAELLHSIIEAVSVLQMQAAQLQQELSQSQQAAEQQRRQLLAEVEALRSQAATEQQTAHNLHGVVTASHASERRLGAQVDSLQAQLTAAQAEQRALEVGQEP